MIEKLKKIGIVITIAVLFTILIFATTNAIYPRPQYEDYCTSPMERPISINDCEQIQPVNCRGPIDYTYDNEGCPIEGICNQCYEEFDLAQEEYNLVLFLVSSIVGIVAILFGLFYRKQEPFWILVKGGFLLGGLISLFVGTGIYYDDMARFLQPAVILIELLVVIFVTYKVIKK